MILKFEHLLIYLCYEENFKMNVVTEKIKNSFLDSVAAESVLRFVSSAFKSAIFLFLSPIASYTNTII